MSAEPWPTGAVASALEVHQIEWIGNVEGWDCGCNERGDLPGMGTSLAGALRHQASAIRDALADHLARREREAAARALREWIAACDEVGVPHNPGALIRHHRGNAALTAVTQAMTADRIERGES